jgi:hypothetical protein
MDSVEQHIETLLSELDLKQDEEHLSKALNSIYETLEKEGYKKSEISLLIQKKILTTTNNMYADLIRILKEDGSNQGENI